MNFDRHWFNLGSSFIKLGGENIKLWNFFNRLSTQDTWWGVGLLQIGTRHLLFAGHSGVCVGFVWIFGRHVQSNE